MRGVRDYWSAFSWPSGCSFLSLVLPFALVGRVNRVARVSITPTLRSKQWVERFSAYSCKLALS